MQLEPDPHRATSWQTRRLNTRISLALKTLIGIGAVLLFVEGNYQAGVESLMILAITFLPLLMRSQFQVVIPHEFETLAIVFIYLSLFLGGVQEFYIRYWWWDLVLHAGAGFLIGITGFLLVYVLNKNEDVELHLTPFFISLFAFMFSMGIGALWEIYEFTIDNLFDRNMQKSGLVDTMWDLIVDAIGALIIAILGYGYLKTEGKDSFLERLIHKFIATNPRLFHKKK